LLDTFLLDGKVERLTGFSRKALVASRKSGRSKIKRNRPFVLL